MTLKTRLKGQPVFRHLKLRLKSIHFFLERKLQQSLLWAGKCVKGGIKWVKSVHITQCEKMRPAAVFLLLASPKSSTAVQCFSLSFLSQCHAIYRVIFCDIPGTVWLPRNFEGPEDRLFALSKTYRIRVTIYIAGSSDRHSLSSAADSTACSRDLQAGLYLASNKTQYDHYYNHHTKGSTRGIFGKGLRAFYFVRTSAK